MKFTRRRFLRGLALLPALVFPALAKAQEPVKVYLPLIRGGTMVDFPCGSILDAANRPNEGPPPSTDWMSVAGLGEIVVDTLQFAYAPAGHGFSVAMWKTATGADCEVYISVPVRCDDGDTVSVFARSDADPSINSYELDIFRDDANGDALSLQNPGGEIGNWPVVFENDDRFGMRLCGSSIECWYYKPATGWILKGTVTDSSITVGGYVGMGLADTTARLDDFGGGSVSDTCCGTTPATEIPVVITKCSEDPILALVCANGDRLDLISWQSGFELDDPGWKPQVAQFKGGGSYSDSMIAEGSTLVAGEYANVTETIPLVARDVDEATCIRTYRYLQQFIKQASDYWKEPSEYNCVWLEVRPAGVGCRTGYARVVKAACADFANPFGQPFASQEPYSVADGLSLVVEREPLWRAVPPGQMIGPLYNLLKNPDFEEWNSGVTDSQPDCWSDLETLGITGQNGRDDSPKWGRYALKIAVTGSGAVGRVKGITQVIEGIENGQEYTFVGWVRSEGVVSGVGRILITSLLGQYEAWRSSDRMGWTLVTYKFTASTGDVIGVNVEILSTAAAPQTLGTIYADSLMLLKGDWEQEALDEMLPYMSSSHIFNHWDTGAGHLNYVDAWEVPGDADGLIRLELMNNTVPADANNQVEQFSTLRIGQRRTNDVQNLQNYYDPGIAADATASGGFRLNFTPSASWVDVLTHAVVGGANTKDNQGRYRVYARLWDAKASGDPTLQARLRYFIGTAGVGDKTLAFETISVRAAWAMLGLTSNAAAAMERKFQTQYPSQIGTTLQLRRPTGTGNAYFDYLLYLPTDGGLLLADLTPALAYRRVLTVDNTGSATISSSYVKEHPWRLDWQVEAGSSPFIYCSCVFKGDLYLGVVDTAATHGQIWRKRNGTYTKVYEDSAPNQPLSLAVFGDYLYAGMTPPGAAAAYLLASIDGLNWSNVYTVPNAETAIYDMVEFEGGLFLICSGGYIERWDGSAGTTEQHVVGSTFSGVVVYGSNLYAIRATAGVDYLDRRVTAGNWVNAAINPGPARWNITSPHRMEVFQNRLYIPSYRLAATTVVGSIYDGSIISSVTLPETQATINNRSFRSYNGKLYAVLRDARTWVSTDGVEWELSFAGSTVLPAAGENWVADVMDGELYIAGYTAVALSAQGYVYTYADINESYAQANYQGGTFTAPNRRLMSDERRHRWVFSFDRSDGSNNIADKALVGLGYVPRYLMLLGEG